jgi:ectoine utilization protein EutC
VPQAHQAPPRSLGEPAARADGGRAILTLSESEVREVVGRLDTIAIARDAFIRLSLGQAELPDVLSMEIREHNGEVHAKGGYIHGAPYYSIKVASGFYGNPALGLPVAAGAVWVFDARTGVLRAMLLDNGHLTDVRTAAAGAVAADLLAREDARDVTVVGAGAQARYQVQALTPVRPLRRVRVWARRPEAAAACARDLTASTGVPAEPAQDLAGAVAAADVVVTVTPSREPLVAADWVRPGTHVTAIGSDLPGKVELAPALLSRARVIVDRVEQCRTQGEVAAAIEAGAITLDAIAGELGDVAAGTLAGRTSPDEITVADLTGVGVLDTALATAVVEGAA